MWTNAQRDGRPAEQRWRPLSNAAKFGWRPLLDCRTVTLPRRNTAEIWWGAPNPPIVLSRYCAWCSPHCGDIWRTYFCLTSIFSDCGYVPWLRRYSLTKLCDGAQMEIFGDFFASCISASRVPHISDLPSNFALRPHHVCKYGRYPMCGRWD